MNSICGEGGVGARGMERINLHPEAHNNNYYSVAKKGQSGPGKGRELVSLRQQKKGVRPDT